MRTISNLLNIFENIMKNQCHEIVRTEKENLRSQMKAFDDTNEILLLQH